MLISLFLRPENTEGAPPPGPDTISKAQPKLLSSARRRLAVDHVCHEMGISERKACRVLGQRRRLQRYKPKAADDEAVLKARINELAKHYGRYGYRRITALLRSEGSRVNHKGVERTWPRQWRDKRLCRLQSLVIFPTIQKASHSRTNGELAFKARSCASGVVNH